MNILIISLAYAPYSGVGAARMTSLSKYLTAQGESVTVLCYDSKVFGDNEQKRDVPEDIERIIVSQLKKPLKNIYNLKKEIDNVLNKRKFELCIISVGPFEPMFIVNRIWKQWKVPYIIDYRDPWVFENKGIKEKGVLKYKIILHDFICNFIEKRAICFASKLVFVTEQFQKEFIMRNRIRDNKCFVIYNGYEDVLKVSNNKKNGLLTIGIAGKFALYNEQAAVDFLQACRILKQQINIRVMHIGNNENTINSTYSDVYQNLGTRNHVDTMKELAQMDVMLICYQHKTGLGTKVFDYIGLNKPIIYIGIKPSELSEFIGRFENAYVCTNINAMIKAIKTIYDNKYNYLTKNDITQYSREKQNEKYYSLLKEIIND